MVFLGIFGMSVLRPDEFEHIYLRGIYTHMDETVGSLPLKKDNQHWSDQSNHGSTIRFVQDSFINHI